MSTAQPIGSPTEDTGGVTLSACALAEAIGAAEDVAERLLAVVSMIVEKYATDAPSEVANEAAIRFAGYLKNTLTTVGLRRMNIGSNITIEPMMSHGSAFHHSGAAGLLARFRTHRGGLIG